MASPLSPHSAILWQNDARTTTLLDIPRSISLAQGTPSHPCTAQIYSCEALQKPFPSTEPKTEKAKANVLRTAPQNDTDADLLEALLHEAHGEIAKNWDRGWCLRRQVSSLLEDQQTKMRKSRGTNCQVAEPNFAGAAHQYDGVQFDSLLGYGEKSEGFPSTFRQTLHLSNSLHCPNVSTRADIKQISHRLVHNPCPFPLHMQCIQSSTLLDDVYIIPPRASFFLSTLDQSTAPAMSMAALTLHPDSSATAGPGQFDFVLLDPPWGNRSVKRSAKYKTMRNPEPFEVLQSMLGLHIAPDALVACWITNKASVRSTALEAFNAWNLQLVEEWAWLKITEHGEPVTDINGIWRKPYEILLVGKMSDDRFNKVEESVQRRVIVAVPDLHSRKPNLRTLFEPMLPAHYRALEVFARNLTAEWMAWGDDVLKHAHEHYWWKPEDTQTSG